MARIRLAMTFLALSCQYIGLRAKTPGRIWLLNLLWGALLVAVPNRPSGGGS